MEKALKHFKKHDPILYDLAMKVEVKPLVKPPDPLRRSSSEASSFVDLVESIINQQLSGKAAATIFGRFKKLFPKEKITAGKLLKLKDKQIRSAGISYSKIKYIKGIANEIVERRLDLSKMETLNDEQVIEEMVKL